MRPTPEQVKYLMLLWKLERDYGEQARQHGREYLQIKHDLKEWAERNGVKWQAYERLKAENLDLNDAKSLAAKFSSLADRTGMAILVEIAMIWFFSQLDDDVQPPEPQPQPAPQPPAGRGPGDTIPLPRQRDAVD